jgi:hypothetical protein
VHLLVRDKLAIYVYTYCNDSEMGGVGVMYRLIDGWMQRFFGKAAGNETTWKAEVCMCVCVRACVRITV